MPMRGDAPTAAPSFMASLTDLLVGVTPMLKNSACGEC